MILTSIHSENSSCWREGAVYVCTWSSNELQGLSPREGKSAAHAYLEPWFLAVSAAYTQDLQSFS